MEQNIVSTKVFFNNHCRFEISGEEVRLTSAPGYVFIFHKDVEENDKDLLTFGEKYSITEVESGCNIITGAEDQSDAIYQADEKIKNNGLDKLKKQVERFVFLKHDILVNQVFSAFIQCNELKTNDEIESFINALERQGLKLR